MTSQSHQLQKQMIYCNLWVRQEYKVMESFIKNFVWSSALFSLLTISAAVDTIAANQTIRDGETIVSAGESFELGFFSPGRSTNRYLGIWYNISNSTVVWVANRETPITDTSGVLRISSEGSLLLFSGGNTVIWSSNSSVSGGTNNLVAQLLDAGNLVVRDESSSDQKTFIWQSFDNPGDTFLPGMKMGKDLVTGRDRNLTSWKSADDPSAGQFVIGIDTNGFPQVFERQGSDPYSRFGPWNGRTFNGMPQLGANSLFSQQFVINQNEIYYEYELLNSSISRMQLKPEGSFERLNWIDRTLGWRVYSTANVDNCARYGICGPYGSCNINNAPACSCMEGFEPKRPEQWNVADWSSGCQRRTPLDCGNGDGFRKISGVKFPDTRSSWYNRSMSLGECELACKNNCNCTAYANLDIREGGTGCLLWLGELMDVREYDENQEIYIRMAASELTDPTFIVSRLVIPHWKMTHDPGLPDSKLNFELEYQRSNSVTVPESGSKSGSNKKKQTAIVILSTTLSLVLIGLTLAVFAWWKKKRSNMERHGNSVQELDHYSNENQREDNELSNFSLSTIATSTNDFSMSNKIGEGGFGPVYKGMLEGRQEIAVKRLSKTSRQGLDEFKNEVRFIAKLQHRNLVKLLGYCTQGDERMLIYEYMPNKSLDLVIFDDSRNLKLDWPRRFHIIKGIARGLLYLHQDSRLQIIHRDLKASNILLDHDMNPKISDFGLARRFSGYESEANTNNVVGTYGYISPEYAVHGLFSVKSDVFSFGVLVLEIVSGKKNRGFSQEEHNDNLLGHAWRLHNEGRSLELVSASLHGSRIDSEVLRSIHIGLLCVQHHAEDRPSMSSVVLMLGNDGVLPPPKQPAFFTRERLPELNSISTAPTTTSIDEVTITLLDAR